MKYSTKIIVASWNPENHGDGRVRVAPDHDDGVPVDGGRINRISRVFGERVADVNRIIVEQSKSQRRSLSERDSVVLDLGAALRSTGDLRTDSSVEASERRAVVDPGIGLGVEVRDIGVGHVDVATVPTQKSLLIINLCRCRS